MRNRGFIKALLILAWLSAVSVFAQPVDTVSFPGLSILDVSFGARGLALAEALGAVPADRFSLYNNPATSAFASQIAVIAGEQNMGFVNSLGFIGLFPFKFGTFCVGLKAATVGGIEIRPDPNNPDYYVENTSVVAAIPAISFARRFGPFSVGAGLKAQTVSLGYNPGQEGEAFTDNKVGLDIGAYQDFDNLGLGFVVQNIGPRFYFVGDTADSAGNPQPLNLSGSLRYSLFDKKLLLLASAGYGNARGIVAAAGVEYSPWSVFSLRAGYNTERISAGALNGLSLGFGLRLANLEVNYSYLPSTNGFGAGGFHGIDVGFHFGTSAEEKERLLAEAQKEALKRALELQKQTSQSLYEQGVSQYNMSRYDDALESWDMALIWWPDNADAQSMIAKVSAEKDKMALQALVDQAKQAYVSKNYVSLAVMSEEILARDPSHSLALFYKEEAQKGLAEELISKAPAALQSDLRQGIEALTGRDYLTAMRSFEKVLDYDPSNAVAQDYIRKTQAEVDRYIKEEMATVNSLISMSRYSEAKNKTRELLKVAPQNAELLQKIGEIDSKVSEDVQRRLERAQEQQSKDPARSEKELKAALELDPANKQAQENLAQIQKAAQKSSQDAQKLYLLGVESYSENNYELAISYWQKVLSIDPNHSNARKNLERAQTKLAALGKSG